MVESLAQHVADLLEHIGVELVDQAHLFQDGDEGRRCEEADLWVDPAGQGLHAAELTRQRADDRLIVNLDPVILDGLIEVADDIIADVAVHRDARQRDIDFLQRAITDLAMRLRLDDAPRDVRIADAARAREEMAAGMVEAVISLGQFMHDFLLHARTVIHRDDMEGIAIDMSVKLIKVAAVKQPQHFLIGVEQPERLLRLRNIETTRQVLRYTWEVAQVLHFLFHLAFLLQTKSMCSSSWDSSFEENVQYRTF